MSTYVGDILRVRRRRDYKYQPGHCRRSRGKFPLLFMSTEGANDGLSQLFMCGPSYNSAYSTYPVDRAEATLPTGSTRSESEF